MIFLNILKIIGIVLVVLLCILLVLILLVLFYPVKYRIFGTEVYDKENKSDIHIRLSWIFHLIGGNVDIDPELTAGLRILFVKKNLIKDSDTSNDRSDNNGDGGSCDSDSCDSDSIESENIKNISETDIKNTDNIAVAEEKINANATKAEKSVSEDEDTNATNAYSDNKGKEKIKRLTGKIKKDDSCKEALNKIKTELINLLKAIMPYKLYLKAEFSTGSPDKTGMVLGILAMFPIGYRNKWKIRPDFEREEIYIDSEFDIKGHIFLYKILVIAIRVLVDKNCRKLYNEIRK